MSKREEEIVSEIWTYLESPVVEAWSSVLLHFLWQGCLVAVLTGALLRLLRPTDSHRRYLLTLSGMICMAAFPLATFLLVAERTAAPVPQIAAAEAFMLPYDELVNSESITATVRSTSSYEPIRVPKPWPDRFRGWLFAVWIIAEVLLVARLALGSILLWRIRRRAEAVSQEIQVMVKRLAKRLGLRAIPQVFASSDLCDAATYGLFRGIVLLPASWLTDMSPAMLEAVLAHELSHIRRYDAWVNLLQRMVETVFFYHPAVWWLSKQVRVEREHSCDAAAVRLTGDRRAFAKTLEAAAQQRASLKFALVSNLGDDKMLVLNRVNRVLNTPDDCRSPNRWPLGLAAILIPILLMISSSTLESLAVDPPPQFADFPVEPSPPDAVAPTPLQPSKTLISLEDTERPPSELAKVTLPNYVIEPPDVLLIEAVKVVPKSPRAIARQDVLQIVVRGTPEDRAIAGQYAVEASGKVNLGPGYGSIEVANRTKDEAAADIKERVVGVLKNADVQVAVTLFRAAGQQVIAGKHLVAPDGTVNLGIYGQVPINGKTLSEAKAAIERHLSDFYSEIRISLDIFAYNSKFFYVIQENETKGDLVIRIPVTGNETVLDAVAQVGGVGQASTAKIWIARPSKNGVKTDVAMPVDWEAITRGTNTSTNYQLMPGDRLFVSTVPDSDVVELAQRFNDLVKRQKYADAIALVRNANFDASDNPVFESLQHHANLLAESLAAVSSIEQVEVASLIGALKTARLADIKLQEALRKPIAAKFDHVTLEQAIKSVAEQLDIDIVIDDEGLAEEGVVRTQKLSLELRNEVSAKVVLGLLLDSRRLSYRKTSGGVLQVTSEAIIDGALITQAYSVRDLLGLPLLDQDGDEKSVEPLDYPSLKNLITATIEPDMWDFIGGPCTVQSFAPNKSLVVSATTKIHDEIVQLFGELREAGKTLPPQEVLGQ